MDLAQAKNELLARMMNNTHKLKELKLVLEEFESAP
jgi:hypothetical protein